MPNELCEDVWLDAERAIADKVFLSDAARFTKVIAIVGKGCGY